jgi:hypothetical protein
MLTIPFNILLDYDEIQEMVQRGDERYQCLLKFRNVKDALESPGGLKGLMVTVFPCTVIEARPPPVTRSAVFSADNSWAVPVREPSFARPPRPRKQRVPEFPPAPPEEPVRPVRKIEEILPPHLRIWKGAIRAGRSESPFTCRRFWSYFSTIKESEQPEMFGDIANSRNSSEAKLGIIQNPWKVRRIQSARK